MSNENESVDGNRVVGSRSLAVVEYITRSLADEPDEIDVEVDERAED